MRTLPRGWGALAQCSQDTDLVRITANSAPHNELADRANHLRDLILVPLAQAHRDVISSLRIIGEPSLRRAKAGGCGALDTLLSMPVAR